VALGLLGCNRHGTKDAGATKEAPLDGQVFIVTRGAENIRLGKLDVYLVERGVFNDMHLMERALAEEKQLRKEFTTAKAAGDECEKLVRDIKNRCSGLVSERDKLVRNLSGARRLREKYRALLNEINKRDEILDRNGAELTRAGSDSFGACSELKMQIEDLPRRIADQAYGSMRTLGNLCKTDADGHFHFMCPVEGSFVLFTRGHRETPNRLEEYQWFVAATPNSDTQKLALLTNDNLIDSPARENLFAPIVAALDVNDLIIPQSQPRKLVDRVLLPREPQWAAEGTYFLISYVSIPTATGVVGLPPGSKIHETTRTGDRLFAKYGELELETPLNFVTDNTELANEIRNADAWNQAQISAWQANEMETDRLLKDEETHNYDEDQRRIEEDYKQMHTLTGESALNRPARP
jgi:hypothetical protein